MRSVAWMSAIALITTLGAVSVWGQGAPTPHDVGRVLATSSMTFAVGRPQLVSQRDGHVLIADGTKRVVVLLDSALGNPRVVLDSAAGKNNSFSAGSFLTTFRYDSTLFFDRGAATLVVLAPSGALVRTMPPPSRGGRGGVSPITALTGELPPVAGFVVGSTMPVSSPSLGLIFRWPVPTPIPRVPEGHPDTVVQVEDSLYVVRMDFVTRKLDTVAKLSIGSGSVRSYHHGGASISSGPALYPYIDDAVVTSDGSLAIFSAREYRIDWVNPDGTRTQGARLSYPWQHITDDARVHMLDSVNARRQRLFDSTVAQRIADSIRTGSPPMTLVNGYGPNGVRTQFMMADPAPRLQPFATTVEVPDYLPAVGRDAVLADGDNDVWIHPIPTAAAGPDAVWDVINRKGELIDRVRITEGRTIVGFGAGGIIYLAAHDAGVTTIQKARWR